DHGAAEEIGGCAGHRQQRGRDEPAGRGFGNRDGLATAGEQGGDLFRLRQQVVHQASPVVLSAVCSWIERSEIRENPRISLRSMRATGRSIRAEESSMQPFGSLAHYPPFRVAIGEDVMAKLGTVSVTGASGQHYELSVYPSADQFKPLGALFLMAKRIPFA